MTRRAREAKAKLLTDQKNTFRKVADEWLQHHKSDWSPGHFQKAEGIVRRVLRPFLDDRIISEITTAEVLAALQVPEAAGKNETAHKAREFASQIFKRAIILQLVANDPTYPIRGGQGLKPVNSKNQPHITNPEEVGELLRQIDEFASRNPAVSFALKLLPLVFTRPGELRLATWQEFDFEKKRWEIPADRMKARREHVVPLASQVIELLGGLAEHTRRSPDSLLFPSVSQNVKPISDATLSKALRTMGYAGKQVPHGFRHTASTLLNAQQKFSPDAIELQLSHGNKDKIRAVYNKWDYMPEREEMMQFWADYLFALKGERAIGAQIA